MEKGTEMVRGFIGRFSQRPVRECEVLFLAEEWPEFGRLEGGGGVEGLDPDPVSLSVGFRKGRNFEKRG